MKKKYYVGLFLVILMTMSIFTLGYNSVLNKNTDSVQLAKVNVELKDLSTTTLDEAPYSQADFPDGIVVVEVFASWCIPCRTSYPEVVKFANNNKNIPVVGIAYDDVSFEVKKFEEEYGKLETVIVSDLKLKEAFTLRSVPQTLIVKDKKIVYKIFGSLKAKDIQDTINLLNK